MDIISKINFEELKDILGKAEILEKNYVKNEKVKIHSKSEPYATWTIEEARKPEKKIKELHVIFQFSSFLCRNTNPYYCT